MITYLYFIALVALIAAVLYGLGVKAKLWKTGILISLIFLAGGWGIYAFHFQQIFVKRYGGVMTIQVPDGQRHIGITWKDDNMWIENYDPKTNRCIFSEYSRGNVLQGRVVIENCNPLMPQN
ncbi:MAG: hypothetical protein C4518_08975 [Desulfobacteraceae bacterium]|nr:MAG: hypothetical protein C4518_08975 [Desulfobacteraceae bacterium]